MTPASRFSRTRISRSCSSRGPSRNSPPPPRTIDEGQANHLPRVGRDAVRSFFAFPKSGARHQCKNMPNRLLAIQSMACLELLGVDCLAILTHLFGIEQNIYLIRSACNSRKTEKFAGRPYPGKFAARNSSGVRTAISLAGKCFGLRVISVAAPECKALKNWMASFRSHRFQNLSPG